jgi:hypothetical protein
MEVNLRIHSLDGIRDIPVSTNRLTLGRTDAADIVIHDSGLSRIHASINRDGDRVWVIDEGSTNGTFVNREPVPTSGLPLNDGDEIDLGETTIVVSVSKHTRVSAAQSGSKADAPSSMMGLPLPIIAASAGIVIILFAVIAIAVAVRHNDDSGQITVKKYSGNSNTGDQDPNANLAPSPADTTATPPIGVPSPIVTNSPDIGPPVPTKRYLAMTPEEQRKFVADEAQRVARMIGNRDGYAFTPEVVGKIKIWVDAYARRLNSPRPSGGCNMRHDLRTLLERAHSHAPMIVKSFNEKGLSAQVGLYLAMIESEYCPCLSSGTGAKGMFQFVGTTARRYGVPFVTANSRDPAPDDRCRAEIMAPIAAQYMKDLIAMFGTGPLSVPLAIASYNEGEGGLSSNLMKALNAARNSENPERSFWTMVANADMMSDQFQREAIKYVPHFFGAAIVGENPRVFGVDLLPISSYTQEQSDSAANQKTLN